MRKIVFCDFDGTITTHDTLDAIQDIYGPSDWRDSYKKLRKEGMTAREVTRKILESCKASPAEVEKLIESIGIRPGFEECVKLVRAKGFEFIINSEGIDLSIKLILHKRGMDDIPYFTNLYVINSEGRPSTVNIHSHPDCPVCGNCKSWHVVQAHKEGAAVVYIGDGLTDRCAAQLADMVFARGELASWCKRHKVEFIPFEDFHEVMREFEKSDFEARLEAESRKDLTRKMKLPSRDYFGKEEVIAPTKFEKKN